MSAFGKFLVVLNLLIAGAFAALLVLDYGEREKKYGHAIDKADLVIQGQPPDKDTVGKEVAAVKGQSLPTQEDEVRKQQSELQGKIDGAEPVQLKDHKLETKVQKLAWALRPFANTFGRREGLNRLMGDPNADPDKFPLLFDATAEQEIKKLPKQNRLADIERRLQEDFTRAYALQDETGKPRKGEDKRMAVAHTLFCAAEALQSIQPADAEPYGLFNKVVAVVGLESAIHEVAIETTTLEGMIHEADYAIERDREAFVREHAAILRTANTLADELKDAQNLYLSKQGEYELADKDRKQQEANVKRLTDALAEARRKTRAMLDEQAQREAVIFKKQTDLRNAVEKNRSLEQNLRELEAKIRGKEVAQ